MPDLIIREAHVKDLPVIQTLINQLMGGSERGISDDDLARRIFDEVATYPGFTLTVAELDDVVVGTSFLAILPNMPHQGRPQAHVDNVVVDESVRGQGIGKALMQDAVDRAEAAGCWGVQLTSRAYRDGAHKFYDALGFVGDCVGFTKDFVD